MFLLFRFCLTTLRPRRRLTWWLLALLYVAALILAHGCHGPDEDHEL